MIRSSSSFVAFLLAAASLAAQAPPDRFAFERSIVTDGDGPRRLAIDGTLLAGGTPFRVVRRGEQQLAEGGLKDLRLMSADGRPVPYLLVSPPGADPVWSRGMLLAVPPTRKTTGFEVDLGSVQQIDRLRVEGLPIPFLKRFALEGSGDREHWTVLVADGTLFDLPSEDLRQIETGFTAGPYRYLRVTWNDTNSARLPMPREAAARQVVRTDGPPATTIALTLERRPSEPGVSRYRIRLPSAGLPIVALELDAGGGYVHRRAVITEARFAGVEAAPVELGSATLVRVTRDGATASAFRIPIAAPSEAEIEMTVTDEANPPLDLRSVSGVLAELPWIYFESPAANIVARYGNASLPPPAYDLEAVRSSLDLARVREAKWGDARTLEPVEAAPQASPLQNTGSTLDPAQFKTVRTIDRAPRGLVALPLDVHALSYSRGPSMRFADVRVLDASNRQVPYVIERRSEPLAVEVTLNPVSPQAAELKADGTHQRSVYAVTLPQPQVYPGSLVVETSARVFQRTVRVGVDRSPDRRHRDAYFDLRDAQTWKHADAETPSRPLQLRLSTPAEPGLLLVVDEGDNAPLPITSARLLLPSYRLRFYDPGEGPLRLVYGRDDLQAPQYDLALLAAQVMGASAKEISAEGAAVTPGTVPEPLVSHRFFWGILTVAVLVLLGLIVKLVRSQDQPAVR